MDVLVVSPFWLFWIMLHKSLCGHVHFCRVGTWEWVSWHMITLCLVHLLNQGLTGLDLSPGFAFSWLLQVHRWVSSIFSEPWVPHQWIRKLTNPICPSLARLSGGAGQDACLRKDFQENRAFRNHGGVLWLCWLFSHPSHPVLSESHWSGDELKLLFSTKIPWGFLTLFLLYLFVWLLIKVMNVPTENNESTVAIKVLVCISIYRHN